MKLAGGYYQSYFSGPVVAVPGTWKGISGGSSGKINTSTYEFEHINYVDDLINAINSGVGLTNNQYGILGSLGEAIAPGLSL